MFRQILAALLIFLPPAATVVDADHGCFHHHNKFVVAQKVIAQEIAVAPFVVTVPVVSAGVPISQYNADYYYSIQDTYQQRAAIRNMIREELRQELKQAFQELRQPQAEQPQYQPPQPRAQPKPSGQAKLQWTPQDDQQLVQLFAQHCVKCHGPDAQKGDLQLLDRNEAGGWVLQSVDELMRWKLHGYTSSAIMPPGADVDTQKAVPSSKLPLLLKWAVTAPAKSS